MTPSQLISTAVAAMTSGGYSWQYSTSPMDEFNETADAIPRTGAFVHLERPVSGVIRKVYNRMDEYFNIRLMIGKPSDLAAHQSEREAGMQQMYGGMYELLQRLENTTGVEEITDIGHSEVYHALDLEADGLYLTFKLKMTDVAVCPS